MLFFNTNHGYLEGLVRGFKNGLLNQGTQGFLSRRHFVQNKFGLLLLKISFKTSS